jgi:hypothetical protein
MWRGQPIAQRDMFDDHPLERQEALTGGRRNITGWDMAKRWQVSLDGFLAADPHVKNATVAHRSIGTCS